jgi:hypothetical protein
MPNSDQTDHSPAVCRCTLPSTTKPFTKGLQAKRSPKIQNELFWNQIETFGGSFWVYNSVVAYVAHATIREGGCLMSDRVLTAALAAQKLGVSTRTIHRWTAAGFFPGAYKLNPALENSPLVIPVADIEEFEQKRRESQSATFEKASSE